MRLDKAIIKTAETSFENRSELRKTRRQRRTQFTDLYGIPFHGQGDATHPVVFYISISPDLVYHMRMQFKLQIQSFTTNVKGGTSSATVDVNNRSLSVSGSSISPNPHDHSTDPHSHNLINGINMETTTASNFRVSIAGIDITAYLMEQHDGEWIDGEGLYPSNDLEDEESFYDVLSVASLMYSEGNEDDADKILEAGKMKKMEISADGPFGCTMYLYQKLNNVGR